MFFKNGHDPQCLSWETATGHGRKKCKEENGPNTINRRVTNGYMTPFGFDIEKRLLPSNKDYAGGAVM